MEQDAEPAKRQPIDPLSSKLNKKDIINQGKKNRGDYFAYLNAFAIIMAAIIGGFVLWYIDQIDQRSSLEIASINTTHSSLDIKVRNPSQSDAIVHNILIVVLEEYDLPKTITLGYLNSSAKYNMPIGDLPVGQSMDMDVSLQVEARRADRFEINLDTDRHLRLRIELKYNKDKVVSDEVTINTEAFGPRLMTSRIRIKVKSDSVDQDLLSATNLAHNQIEREALPKNKSQAIIVVPAYIIREVRMG
jgi:hypothetical protein